MREVAADRREAADEVRQIVAVAAETIPIGPSDLVVLTIGVVVAVLRVSDFIAGKAKAVSINVVAKDPAGVPTALFEQASNDPTVLANAVDITGTNPAQ